MKAPRGVFVIFDRHVFYCRVRKKLHMAHSHTNLVFDFMEMITRVLRKLNQDEILYWSRSDTLDSSKYEDYLGRFLQVDFSVLARYLQKQEIKYGDVYSINQDPNDAAFFLYKKIVSTIQDLKEDQLVAWLNSEELLMQWFKMGELEFLKNSVKEYPLAPQEESDVNIFTKKIFKRPQGTLSDMRSVFKDVYRPTVKRVLLGDSLICRLNGSEIINYIGGEDAIARSVFSPAQILSLASKQTTRGFEGPLSQSETNIFPIRGKNDFYFISLYWESAPVKADHERGRWYTNLWTKNKHKFSRKGIVFTLS